MTKFNTIWELFPKTNWVPDSVVSQGNKWMTNPEFRRAVATIGMLLHKADLHRYSIFRIGSPSSRFTQCTALGTMTDFLNMTEWNEAKIVNFMWVASPLRELHRIMQPGKEISVSDSYLSYVIHVGLIVRGCTQLWRTLDSMDWFIALVRSLDFLDLTVTI